MTERSNDSAVDEWARSVREIHQGRELGEKEKKARRFIAWLGDRDIHFMDATPTQFDAFLGDLPEKYGHNYHLGCEVAIRHLYEFHFLGQGASANPTTSWTPKIKPKETDYIFPAEKLRHVFETGYALARQSKTLDKRARHFRCLAVIELVYSSGVAEAEVRAMSPNVLDTAEEGFLVVTGKSGVRNVPITPQALDAIQEWQLAAAAANWDTTEKLFPYPSLGEHALNAHISAWAASIMGREGPVMTLDALRAAFAAHLINAGADPRLVAYVLGLKRLKALERHLANASSFADAGVQAQ
ncbi:tyrosine-type recombinase/integrase [Devosia sp.]|uniref:site-specific integrase n=1 Tax=Devosia sp. TaxID=1871048 RepID=UPI0025EB92AF|nr:tyrosine-type recombinase/integrase [Devosia sp.]MCR6634765.1 tyrosine-type recombinase/integrase [Devosia sp.]